MKQKSERRENLVDAAQGLILAHGVSATTIDDICAGAGVSKGAFFHYFSSKEEICISAMEAWSGGWERILESAKLDEIADPYDRMLRLFEIMCESYTSFPDHAGCVTGTVAQELAIPNETLRSLCYGHFENWVARTSKLLADAKAARPPRIDFDPVEVAWWLQTFVQGTLLIAKTRSDKEFILNNIGHCRRYVELLFGCDKAGQTGTEAQ